MCKKQMLMKPEMEVITNTQENQILYTLTTGGTEYNLILHIQCIQVLIIFAMRQRLHGLKF